MTDETYRYFAYGSNLATARLQARVPSARCLGRAVLPGHRLAYHKRGADGSAKCDACCTGLAADEVQGVVFEIAAAELPSLDAAEGPRYERVELAVAGEAGRLTALTYRALPAYIDDTLTPYCWYRDHVLHGAREHGLPAGYIAERLEVACAEDPDAERCRQERAVHAEPAR
ncbi:MAG: gamma-glutamylcyclotransferase family protein [Halorhodospira sp.]